MDQALPVWMYELDRIFDRDEVQAARVVDQIDDRRERCRFARTGRTGHEHKSTANLRDATDLIRQPELLDGHDLRRNHPEHGARSALLPEKIHAEARQRRNLVRE